MSRFYDVLIPIQITSHWYNNQQGILTMVTIKPIDTGPLPPRPTAIATLLTDDEFLPGVQTLLYSTKKHFSSKFVQQHYKPELIVLITPNVSKLVRKHLFPAFCTRLLEVEPTSAPIRSNEVVSVPCDKYRYTKLHIFRMEVYDKIVYINSDCLVLKDLSHLFNPGDESRSSNNNLRLQSRSSLLAAAPDIHSPNKFDTGLISISPKKSVYDDMVNKLRSLVSSSANDSEFLNSYFSDWCEDVSSCSHLSAGYNTQSEHCEAETFEDIIVLHYRSSPKPWDNGCPNDKDESINSGENKKQADKLNKLWKKWYERSRTFHENFLNEENAKKSAKATKNETAGSSSASSSPRSNVENTHLRQKDIHSLITRRFKELRKKGLNIKDAMEMARAEYVGNEQDARQDPGSKVAAMFGMQL